MDDALLTLREFESRARDRKNSRKRKKMIDSAIGPAIAAGAMAAAGTAVKAGAFKLKDEVYSKKESDKKDKDLSSTEGSFKKGGLVRSGKPKLAKKGWR